MQKRESKFCSKLQRWMKYNMKGINYVWEAKCIEMGKVKRFYFNYASTPKEIRKMKAASQVYVHKHSDIARQGTPFDGFTAWGSAAFFFIKYDHPKNKEFFVIELSDVISEIETGSKSLTECRAREIASLVGRLA